MAFSIPNTGLLRPRKEAPKSADPLSPTGDARKESYYAAGQWRLMWKKLRAHRLAQISMVILGALYLGALFGGFIAPYGLQSYDSSFVDAPPTPIRLFHEGEFIGPHVNGLERSRDPDTLRTIVVPDESEVHQLRFFTEGREWSFFGLFSSTTHLFGVDDPGRVFLFGTDSMGRDLFSRIVLGSQVSLSIPLVGVGISFVLGLVIGSVAGYFGGTIDFIIQRLIEILRSFPTLPLWMALAAAIPSRIPVVQMFLYITIILAFVEWTTLARVVRSKFVSLKNEDYVMAARVSGVHDFKIIAVHLVPGFMSYLVVAVTLAIPAMILGETALSFLGLGIQAPATSWGVLLQEAQNVASVAYYPWKLIPLGFVIMTVLAFNFLGDGLRDAADPYK
ncbi:ABC transporter permease [Bogoriella caseilytica]|uniref:Peptide/nickel transport system permease protein n=1 Tax=Bogoriella caseilytica TaxID=56055 RepID=A0A3N2BD35_9MICO|nr:ABC transporter permease [Bogoriella caseilytica]ROR73142.1 peptide/nickel transport system permease protein [Bogoriella caseilytica]